MIERAIIISMIALTILVALPAVASELSRTFSKAASPMSDAEIIAIDNTEDRRS
tara:strand:+ start:486 stop:647 length:162 start_codon:yes stop_codon:yes gene_type:complete